jgi:hypothetical protein
VGWHPRSGASLSDLAPVKEIGKKTPQVAGIDVAICAKYQSSAQSQR